MPLTKTKIKHVKCKSSNVASFGYDEKSQVLEVKYKNSKTTEAPVTYQYSPVTKEQFEDLKKAESKGKWMHQNVRSNARIKTSKIG